MRERRLVFESQAEPGRNRSIKTGSLKRLLKLVKFVFVASRARGIDSTSLITASLVT